METSLNVTDYPEPLEEIPIEEEDEDYLRDVFNEMEEE